MTTPTDQLSPDTLEKYFRSGTVTVHHVNDSPEVDITIDGPGQKISVLTPRKGMCSTPLRCVVSPRASTFGTARSGRASRWTRAACTPRRTGW